MSTEELRATAARFTRREFASLSAAGVTALAAGHAVGAQPRAANEAKKPLIHAGDTILFQGDSITDAGRKRDVAGANSQPALGNGHAWLAASQLLVDRADDELEIYNRGISGNKVFQLAERWQADCLDLKPDVLSILIGVNDIWHKLNGQYDGTVEKYESDYGALLKRTREALPEVRLVICEPFVLRCGAVTDKWFPEFDKYRAAARRVAEEARATFVAFQSMFDAASKIALPERWAADGVHPSADGAALMAHTWLKAVEGLS
jgi:lysophospholipase L1-like esterase